MLESGEEIILKKTGLKAGDKVVIVSGNTPSVGSTNIIKVYTLGCKP
jgi:pyruvate kinase